MITYSSTLRPGRDTLYLSSGSSNVYPRICTSSLPVERDEEEKGTTGAAANQAWRHRSRSAIPPAPSPVDIHCVSFLRPCHPRARFLFFLLFLRFSLFPLLSPAARLLFDSSPPSSSSSLSLPPPQPPPPLPPPPSPSRWVPSSWL